MIYTLDLTIVFSFKESTQLYTSFLRNVMFCDVLDV